MSSADEGTPFGRYRLLSPLGKGGMGQVFRAYDTETERIVAVKVLPPALAEDEKFQERFRREAHAAARLSEPHVVPIHHFGEIDGKLYVDMRLIDGQDLGQILKRSHYFGIDPARAVTLVGQIAEALHAAHRAGLVHRDVKPTNILVTEHDFAYLIDFGIVRASEEETLTASGMTMGTVSYMSPEQFTTGEADARSDVYALACVLFECLTGHPPFPGDLKQKSTSHVSAPVPLPSRERRGVSPAFDAVIAMGMAKDPERRFQTTIELADAARGALREPEGESTGRVMPPRPTRPTPRPQAPLPPAKRYDPERTDKVAPPIPQRAQMAPQRPPAYPPGPQMPPQYGYGPQMYAPRPPWWQSRWLAIALVLVAVIAVVVAIVVVSTSGSSSDESSASSGRDDTSQDANDGDEVPLQSGEQTTLPVDGLPNSIAVDGDDNVYVGALTVLFKYPSGTTKAEDILLTDRVSPYRMVAQSDGTLYMIALGEGEVMRVPPDSTKTERLPFDPIELPTGIAVAPDGTVYAADLDNDRVLMLEEGADRAAVLDVDGLTGVSELAVDPDGNLYVATAKGIAKVEKGATDFEVIDGGPIVASGLACDRAGNVYVSSSPDATVTRWSVADEKWEELPFDGLDIPGGVAVGADDSVYVINSMDEVLKLAAE